MKNISPVSFLLISAGLFAQISQDGLLAYYSFNGNVLDFGLNEYHGQNFGGNFDDDVEGDPISALKLNGMDEFVDLTSFSETFRYNLIDATIYVKIKFDKLRLTES